MPSAWVATVAPAIALCSLASCGDSQGPSDCTGPVIVTVGSGLAPQLSWTPRCQASDVLVESVAPGSTTNWRVTMLDASNSISSPVAFGDTLPGALNSGIVVPLVAGIQYRAVVGRTDSAGHIVLAGETSFTP